MAPLLDLRQVAIRFGGVTALDGVDLAVASQEIHGLIGPNGAGKTTLLNVICRIARPNAGAACYAGQDLLRVEPQRLAALGISRTFQNLALIDDASVIDNVLIGLHSHRPGGLIDQPGCIRPRPPRDRSAPHTAMR